MTTWNAAIVFQDLTQDNPCSDRSRLFEHIDLAELELSNSVEENEREIALVLGCESVTRIGRFYDRDVCRDEWYYAAYARSGQPAIGPARHPMLTRNSIISTLLGREPDEAVIGPVCIIKDGPAGGRWEATPNVNTDDVGRTMWWYMRSGLSVEEVLGLREFSRYLRNVGL